jgi:hypothetical protein
MNINKFYIEDPKQHLRVNQEIGDCDMDYDVTLSSLILHVYIQYCSFGFIFTMNSTEAENLSNMPKKLSDEESSVDSSNDYNKDHTKPSTEKDNESPTEPYYYPDEIYDRNMKRESKLPQASKASKAFKDQPAIPPSSKAFKDDPNITPENAGHHGLASNHASKKEEIRAAS